MPFIPHTEDETNAMLATCKVNSIDDLFDEVPTELKQVSLSVPEGLTELEITRLMQNRNAETDSLLCFAGAGAYEHHIPAAVWEITTRGEFYSAYTPYQAEASQGTLQLIFEYQTMISGLCGLDAANASLYDGATAVAEAVLMAIRANRKCKSKHILLAATLNPHYLDVVKAIVSGQGVTLEVIDYDKASGTINLDSLDKYSAGDFNALVIPQPNFFGGLEEVDTLTDWAHERGALVIGVVNPTSLALITPPGEWGERGADIACGEGQPLGVPLSGGGPYFGFMCTKMSFVRQMPGRIVGETIDADGKTGYVLTLQAREQHIRRSKATSNICTNQGLMVTAATIYMSIMGFSGLRDVATQSVANLATLTSMVASNPSVNVKFTSPNFHEVVFELPVKANTVIDELLSAGILAGVDLGQYYPEMENCLLVCTTETKTKADLQTFASSLLRILEKKTAA